MHMRPHIKVQPTTLGPPHPSIYVCKMRHPHNLHWVEGSGMSFRTAYLNWLDQVGKFC